MRPRPRPGSSTPFLRPPVSAVPGAVAALLLLPAGCAPGTPAPPPLPGDLDRLEVVAPDAPPAIGPYSQAIRAGQTVYLAGQLGIDPATGELVQGGIEAETRQAMENLGAVLRATGLGFEHVVLSQVFLRDVDEFAAMNEVYGAYFQGAPPARATVEVARLPRDGRVEIQMTAVGPLP